ncbi:hypothetical protein MUK42_02559, partial [Musa troglodytarum]
PTRSGLRSGAGRPHHHVGHPTKTVIGINAVNRRLWVHTKVEAYLGIRIRMESWLSRILRNNIMASTLLATTVIMLWSVIVYLMTNSEQDLVLGDRSKLGLSVELFSMLVCFAFAFLLNIEAVRYYSHVSILINVPLRGRRSPAHLDTAEHVIKVMNKGSYFWSGGLHAFYLSLPFFLVFRGVSDPAGGETAWSSTNLGDIASMNALRVAVDFIGAIGEL